MAVADPHPPALEHIYQHWQAAILHDADHPCGHLVRCHSRLERAWAHIDRPELGISTGWIDDFGGHGLDVCGKPEFRSCKSKFNAAGKAHSRMLSKVHFVSGYEWQDKV